MIKNKRYIILTLAFFLSLSLSSKAQDNPFLQTNPSGQLELTQQGASHFAQLALTCLQQEFPNKLSQVLKGVSDLQTPESLHPTFYGCFDWHSSVHGHWMLVRLLRQFPDLPEGDLIRQKLEENLTDYKIERELAYFTDSSKSWERMYGWSWLLKLSEELYAWEDVDAQRWWQTLAPLTNAIIDRYKEFLPKQKYPVRTGVHPNTAFGMSFAWDFAKTSSNEEFKKLLEDRARDYYLNDVRCPVNWEPSGEDFLSPCLEEASLMQRVLAPAEFKVWFKKFIHKKDIPTILNPVDVSDRSDGKLVHLDGVNLSRAWSMYQLLPEVTNKKQKAKMTTAAAKHLQATVPFIASEYYEGTHWLASFAVYALSVGRF